MRGWRRTGQAETLRVCKPQDGQPASPQVVRATVRIAKPAALMPAADAAGVEVPDRDSFPSSSHPPKWFLES
jgi:hypothetical protein